MAEIRIAVSMGGWNGVGVKGEPDLVEIAVPVPDRIATTGYEHRALIDTVAASTVALVEAVRKPLEPIIEAEVVDETDATIHEEEKDA